MDVRQLEYFLAVVRTCGFSNAVYLLGLTQPVLNRQIAQLEDDLRVRLLVRNGRGVEPTESGQSMAEHAQAVEYPLVLPSGPHAVRRLIEMTARPRNLNLKAVAEVDSVQAVLPLVKRGLARS